MDVVNPVVQHACREARERPERFRGTAARDPGNITTIEDKTSVAEARQSWLQLKEAVAQGRS
jgi:hypothetical protein